VITKSVHVVKAVLQAVTAFHFYYLNKIYFFCTDISTTEHDEWATRPIGGPGPHIAIYLRKAQ
jgi:hypothetical protein